MKEELRNERSECHAFCDTWQQAEQSARAKCPHQVEKNKRKIKLSDLLALSASQHKLGEGQHMPSFLPKKAKGPRNEIKGNPAERTTGS